MSVTTTETIPQPALPRLNWEQVLFAAIVLLGLLTRFTGLGERTMSHDETQHTYFSWELYQGNGYTYTPITHGPLQFHLMALSYAVFGDSDFGARVPHALFSVAAIALIWLYRRWLGRAGAMIAAGMMVISPFLMYYGRYARNEAFTPVFGLVTLWAILRYLESGKKSFLFWLVLASAFHFTDKATSFIYTAQALIFLGLLFLQRMSSQPWRNGVYKNGFLVSMAAAALFLGGALFGSAFGQLAIADSEAELPAFFVQLPFIFGVLSLALAGFFLLRGHSLAAVRAERSFDLIMLLGMLVLPQLAPIPVYLAGGNPLDTSREGVINTALFAVPMILLAIAMGWWWGGKRWLVYLGVFYGIFIALYSTLFTYLYGPVTGLVGALGYWMEQHGVVRGNQPLYYYALIQVPVYEYLPLIGTVLAGIYGVIAWLRGDSTPQADQPASVSSAFEASAIEAGDDPQAEPAPQQAPALLMFGFWAVSSFAAYTLAGERMPWLTVHIAWPMILCAGWAFSKLIGEIDWGLAWRNRGWLAVILLPVFTLSVNGLFSILRPLIADQVVTPANIIGISAVSGFMIASGGGLLWLLRLWNPVAFARLLLLAGLLLLSVFTTRSALAASFIRGDQATEFMVYAHSGPANKALVSNLEELSMRLYGDLSLPIAYDNSDGEGDPASAWPLTWYIRHFSNRLSFSPDIGRELLDYPVIFVSDGNWGKIEPILRGQYQSVEVVRMWWPMQDYFDLTTERITAALTNPDMRDALWDIWFDRDYRAYAQVSGNQSLTLDTWQPSRRMRMYVRNDIAGQVWDRGSAVVAPQPVVDPYSGVAVQIFAEAVIGVQGDQAGQFNAPRAIAAAPDGSLYAADTFNHRIQRLDAEGNYLGEFGGFSGVDPAASEPGLFNEPWGVAVGPDGSVYVSDTWNHRVQKFSAEGELITAWGRFGQAEDLFALWGPRGIAVDDLGRVFVADTGNKRIAVYDAGGNPLTQLTLGFSEPVGLAVDSSGGLWVADTWNQRIVLARETAEDIFTLESEWLVDAWYGESLENKPYLAVSQQGTVVFSDPEGYRLIALDNSGQPVLTFGVFGTSGDAFALPAGLTFAPDGRLWVVDVYNHRLMAFRLP